ncbi:MAG: tripartite tricarboxylate transporter permease, partial [Clostridia bacterium]|nr:tripartite tricarboxylate transporter permease [Clostridia bacterium]
NMIFAALLLAAILVFVVELLTKRWFPKLLNAPYHYLYGSIVMICFMGAFASGNSMFNVYEAIIFCVFGILMMVLDIPMSPLMLSYILGQKLEYYFRLGTSYAEGSYASFFTRPISGIFLVIGIYSLFSPLIKSAIKKAKAKKTAA